MSLYFPNVFFKNLLCKVLDVKKSIPLQIKISIHSVSTSKELKG